MQIQVIDPVTQTIFFSVAFFSLVALTIRKSTTSDFFPVSTTNELKGFAILAIIFSHIGYFLSTDTKFLFPLSILAGVGVNLFLFLSGFGLTLSQIKKPLDLKEFYLKRLLKLFIPLWLILIIFLVIDKLILGVAYPPEIIKNSFLGWYPQADIFLSFNSPLWYFTLILFYYLLFPLFYIKKYPILSPILLVLFSLWLFSQKWFLDTSFPLTIKEDVFDLYKLHFIAFPLGMFVAIVTRDFKAIKPRLGLFFISLLFIIFVYTAFNSGVGEGKKIEQLISLVTMFAIILIFMIKNFEIRFFTIFGIFAYEIYLIHWPILLRYGYLYKLFPAWFATLAYLLVFLVIAFLLNCLIARRTPLQILKKIT
jgi:peptidoglycan/LPS O-acetylase OafA/YrhL